MSSLTNAGFGEGGSFTRLSESVHRKMLVVRAAAVMRLTHAALPPMIAAGKGVIMSICLAGRVSPVSRQRNVRGTKRQAFVSQFTESLYLRASGAGVKVQALCPGCMTRTDFHRKMGLDPERSSTGQKDLMKAMTPRDSRGGIAHVPQERHPRSASPGPTTALFT